MLLVRRGRAPSKGFFAFPGGRVEAGESLEGAARRELLEETTLSCGPLHLVETLDIDSEPGTAAFRLHVFTASYIGGVAVAGDDAATADWFTLDEMTALPVLESVVAVAVQLLGAKGSPEFPAN